jgi:hypothetical protein
MWLDAGELQSLAKEHRQNVITQMLSDALSTFGGSPKTSREKPVHDPRNPAS